VADLELVPPEEAKQIDNIVRLTVEQLKKRYPGEKPVRRGVHPKDHGCVKARFTVSDPLAEDLRVGVFKRPGHQFDAWIRFSNADVRVRHDSPATNGVVGHGSRGMAVKLMGVDGSPLLATNGPVTQDFLMVNQPVFAFANVEDYEVLSQALVDDGDKPDRFFARVRQPDPVGQRARTTLGIVQRIQSTSVNTVPAAYQVPPVSPLDNRYFSAAPYLFGTDRAMKYAAKPVSPAAGDPDLADENYLRTALRKRLTAPGAKDVLFEFQAQVRSASSLAGKIETEIEDACVEWKEAEHPFVTLATIAIPPQDFDTAERNALCENLFFTPWHGIAEHRPIGGINRLKRAVYEASSMVRHMPKEPAHF
jgi:hypothetical protein